MFTIKQMQIIICMIAYSGVHQIKFDTYTPEWWVMFIIGYGLIYIVLKITDGLE